MRTDLASPAVAVPPVQPTILSSREAAAPLRKRAIPSLDGLRAISVAMVIFGHTESAWLDRIPGNTIFRMGGLGVNVFFVISGFLITHLLLKEMTLTGGIDLKRFYLRRAFRIFPPFYVFLIVIALLHLPDVTPRLLLYAGTYTWNYLAYGNCFVLGHTWSLAVEEQFYFLWPAVMLLGGKIRSLWIAISLVLLSPFIRIATYFAFPTVRGHVPIMTHTHLDPIMAGCAAAILIEQKRWQRLFDVLMYPAVVVAAVLFLLVFDPILADRLRGNYVMTAGISLETVSILSILLFVVFRSHTLAGRMLNFAPLRHIGTISYSLYLWQQLFTGERTHQFPLNIVWIVLCAELSYFVIEKPSFSLRDRAARLIFGTRES